VEFSHIGDKLDFPAEDFVILSMETSHRPDMARKILLEDKISWPSLDDDEQIASKLFGVTGVPTNIFIDREGRMVFRSNGFAPGDERNIVEMVQALLDRP
jgi:hypothetical protein